MNYELKKILSIALLMTSWLTLPLSAADHESEDLSVVRSADMKFRRLDTRDGLSNSQILSIMRDSKGFVWIGTPYGLNRYDGYRFKTFYSEVKDTMTLRNNYIDEIYEAGDGQLWLRQGMNYTIFNPRTEKCDRHPERILAKMGVKGGVERIYIDNEKNYWVKTFDEGFWHIYHDGSKQKQFPFGYGDQEFNNDIGIAGFIEDGNLLYVTSNNGDVLCFDKSADRIVWKNNFLHEQQIINNQDCKPRVDTNGNLWLISLGVAHILNTKTNTWHHSAQEALHAWGYENVPDEISLWDMRTDNEGRLWLATDHGGLLVADPKEHVVRQFLNNKFDESTISDNTIRVLMRDQLGRMWIGTYSNGLNLYSGSLSNFVNIELGNINTICVDRQGFWWLGTNDKGILRYDPRTQEQVVYSRENSGFRSNTMVGSMAARDGSVWFGTYEGGIIHIKNGHVTNILASNDTTGLLTNNVWTLCEDLWGNIWVGTLGAGVQRIDKHTGKMRTFRISNSRLPSDYINLIQRTKKGWMYVAHSQYLSCVNPKTFQIFNFNITKNKDDVPITESGITSLEDSRELIWQGSTQGATIWDRKGGHVYLLDMKSGLFGSTVNSIVEDANHTIWLSTDHGVSNVVPQKQEDGTWSFVVRSYNNRDGLQDGPYNQRSMCCTPDGLILVGGQGGLDVINPKNMGKGRIREVPIFSGLQIFDQDVNVGQKFDGRLILEEDLNDCREITLNYNDQFTIQLASSSGEIHNRSRFVYRLEGFNDNWVKTSEVNPNITYNSLSAGDYKLRVRMLNDDGTLGEDESVLEITIRPPFWRTSWMMLIYILLIAAAAWWWRKWFLKRHAERVRAQQLQMETAKMQWMSEMRRKMQEENAFASVSETAPVEEAQPQMALTLEDFNLVDFVKESCKQFAAGPLGSRAKVSCRSMVDELLISADREKMTQLMDIMLGNAVKFSPGDCHITVNLGRGEGDRALMQIADNSIGIPEDSKATAFDPMIGEEGIGLDVVKNIVVAHGGDIRLEDNPGGGTIFFISLPVHPEPEVIEAEVIEG
jgi:ligand-binding sensor domain-containing protein